MPLFALIFGRHDAEYQSWPVRLFARLACPHGSCHATPNRGLTDTTTSGLVNRHNNLSNPSIESVGNSYSQSRVVFQDIFRVASFDIPVQFVDTIVVPRDNDIRQALLELTQILHHHVNIVIIFGCALSENGVGIELVDAASILN